MNKWNPTEKQKEFLESKEKRVLFSGSYHSGYRPLSWHVIYKFLGKKMKQYYIVLVTNNEDGQTLFRNTETTLTNDIMEAWRTEDINEAEQIVERYKKQYTDNPALEFEVGEIDFKLALYHNIKR